MSDDRIQGAVIAASATARRRVQAHFMALHAITPDDAIEYVPRGSDGHREFDRLRAAGIIRTSAPGNYWLDMTRLDARDERRRRQAVPIALAIAVAVAVGMLIFYRG